MDEERKYWVAFSVFPGIGPVRFKLLLDYFGTAKKAWNASQSALQKIRLPQRLIAELVDFRKTHDHDEYQRRLDHEHVSVLTINDPKYPKLLKQISDAPFLLYIKGHNNKKPINLNRTIAVVGTRQITPYGQDVTRRLVEGLVSYGFTIVSGLAYGVDAAAHRAAISSGGKTIAVLGCGIDIIAPPCNTDLYYQIAQGGHGAIVSEMPLGLRPGKGLFPARNRIISGLSLGVVVTEGAGDSGALITARNAGEQGREVFAVPGPITSPYSQGPAKLLRNGAKLVESVEDILEELGIQGDPCKTSPYKTRSFRGETKEEQKILGSLATGVVHIDEIVRSTNLTIAVVGSTLTLLEMKGMVKNIGENQYRLNEVVD
jgi:DNA processing protein